MKCYEEHKKIKKITCGSKKGEYKVSLCDQFWECPSCGITIQKCYRSPTQHACGEMKCSSCNEYFLDENHLCYMRATYNEKDVCKFIFYDFECYVKDDIHIPNYVVAITVCDFCEADDFNENSICHVCDTRCQICDKYNIKEKEFEHLPCVGCCKRTVIFKGENTKKDFVNGYFWINMQTSLL